MQPDPFRVIAYCSLILGCFFLAKSVSIKTPKYVLHELLAFKVNKSRFFRRYISQRLESWTGFLFLLVGFGLLAWLEVNALRDQEEATAGPGAQGFTNWWLVMGATVAVTAGIAILLSKVNRWFSGQIFVEHVKFMVEHHGYPLERDEALLLELGKVMRIQRSDEDTIESYCEKVRKKMAIEGRPPNVSQQLRAPYR